MREVEHFTYFKFKSNSLHHIRLFPGLQNRTSILFSDISNYSGVITTVALKSFQKYFSLSKLKFFNNESLTPSRLSATYRKRFWSKYFYIGLGYKIYIYKGFLFIWVGLTHYTLLKLHSSIKVFPKKKRIYIVSTDQILFNNFLLSIRRARKMDIYKGKGLLEVKTYKGFLRMKSGKKKQY